MNDSTLVPLLIVTSVGAASALVAAIGLFVALGRIMNGLAAIERQVTNDSRATHARLDALVNSVTERPSTTVLRDVLQTEWKERIEPGLRATVQDSLPKDLTAALVIEALERIGVEVPRPPPPVPDDQLLTKVREWVQEGVRLAEQAGKNSPELMSGDKFRIAQKFVLQRLQEHQLEFSLERLAQLIEEAVYLQGLSE